MESIDKKIADLRRFGLSDRAIAEKCGCSLNAIYNYRFGITKTINPVIAATINRLHSAIDWSIIDEQ